MRQITACYRSLFQGRAMCKTENPFELFFGLTSLFFGPAFVTRLLGPNGRRRKATRKTARARYRENSWRIYRPNKVGLAILPVSLNLLRPASITFPGVKRRIDTGTSATRRRCFRNPPAVLLPPVRFRFVCGARRILRLIDNFISRLIMFAAPGCVLAVLHVKVLVQSFEEM